MGKYLANGTGTADAMTDKNSQSLLKDKLIFGSHLNVSKSLHCRPAIQNSQVDTADAGEVRSLSALFPGAGKGPFGCSGDLLAASVLRCIGEGTCRW